MFGKKSEKKNAPPPQVDRPKEEKPADPITNICSLCGGVNGAHGSVMGKFGFLPCPNGLIW